MIINDYIVSIPSLAIAEESVSTSTVGNASTGDSWGTAGGNWGLTGGSDASVVPIFTKNHNILYL